MKKILLIVMTLVLSLFIFTASVSAETTYTSLTTSVIECDDNTLQDGWYTLNFTSYLETSFVAIDIHYYSGISNTFRGEIDAIPLYIRNMNISEPHGSFDVYIEDGYFKLTAVGSAFITGGSFTLTFSSRYGNLFDDTKIVAETVNSIEYLDTALENGVYGIYLDGIVTNGDIFDVYSTYNGVAFSGVGSDIQYFELVGTDSAYMELKVLDGDIDLSLYWYDTVTHDGLTGDTLTITNFAIIPIVIYNDLAPVFNYTELTLESTYYDIPTVSEVTALLSVTDDLDGDLTSSITVYDENITSYVIGNNIDIINDYYITYSVEDTTGNTSYLTVNMNLYSDKIMTITQSDPIHTETTLDVVMTYGELGVGTTKTFDIYIPLDIMQELTDPINSENNVVNTAYIYDNYISLYIDYVANTYLSSQSDILSQDLSESISEQITAVYNGTQSFVSPDIISLNLSVESPQLLDTVSLLDIQLDIQVIYYDNVDPSFDDTPTVVTTSNISQLTLTELETYVEMSDNADISGNLTLALVSDDYTINYDTEGRYEVIYSLEDTASNIAYHTFVIYVVDMSPPLYVVDSSFIVVSENQPILETDLEDILVAYGIVVTKLSFEIDVLQDDYLNDTTTRGDHTMRLLITYEDDTSEIIELSIRVEPETTGFSTLLATLTSSQKILSLSLGICVVGLAVYGITKLKRRKQYQ